MLKLCSFSINWIKVLILSLLLKLTLRKKEHKQNLGSFYSFFLLIMYFTNINLPFSLAWNTGLVFLPTNIQLCKVDDRNTRNGCEVRSKLKKRTRRPGIFIVSFEHILYFFLLLLLLNLNK